MFFYFFFIFFLSMILLRLSKNCPCVTVDNTHGMSIKNIVKFVKPNGLSSRI